MTASLNAQDISKYALRLIGALGHGEDLQGEDYDIALTSLNLVLERIQRLGHIPINVDTEKIDMVASTATYSLSNTDTIDIISAYARDTSGDDSRLDIIPTEVYDRIVDKDDDSDIPQKLLFSRTNSPSITLWPVPNDADVDVYIRQIRSATEATAAAGTLDIPSSLYKPVGYLMAADLAPQYGGSLRKADYFRRLGDSMLSETFSQIADDLETDIVPGAFDSC